MLNNQKGSVGVVACVVFVVAIFLSLFVVRFQSSNQVVSGIVYNTKNDGFLTGNTTFSVRASEDTYVSEGNRSSYCLPPNSEYKDLVNKAAEDKSVKVIVTANKYFAIQAPWTCKNNVKVELSK